jgi:hypothetical protein
MVSGRDRAEIVRVFPSQSAAADIRASAAAAQAVDILAVRGLGIVGSNGTRACSPGIARMAH